jgi:phosphoglycolate phosphatase-like HAD superfamily hydrolase
MDVIVSSDDVDRSKPAPDVITTALEKAELRPAEAILVGDTPYDIAAARRAGVRAIALRSGEWPDGALAGASAIYDDVADFYAHLHEIVAPNDRRRRACAG